MNKYFLSVLLTVTGYAAAPDVGLHPSSSWVATNILKQTSASGVRSSVGVTKPVFIRDEGALNGSYWPTTAISNYVYGANPNTVTDATVTTNGVSGGIIQWNPLTRTSRWIGKLPGLTWTGYRVMAGGSNLYCYAIAGVPNVRTLTITGEAHPYWIGETITASGGKSGTVIGYRSGSVIVYSASLWAVSDVITGGKSTVTATVTDAGTLSATDGTLFRYDWNSTWLQTSGSWSGGTPIAGEQMVQATSGARGYFTGGYLSAWYKSWMPMTNCTGTWDTTHAVTGATSGAYWTPNAVLTNMLDAARAVIQPGYYVTAGTDNQHGFAQTPNGLFLAAYAPTTPGVGGLWHSADNGVTWTELIHNDDTVDGYRHFHSATYFPASRVADGQELFVLGTGDADNQVAICICRNVADLVANPSTWATNWAVHLQGASHTNYLGTTGAAYNLGYGSQYYRVIAPEISEDGQWLYWLPDGSSSMPNVGLHRVNIATKEVQFVGTTGISGWVMRRLSSGKLAFGSASEYFSSSFDQSSAYGYLHLIDTTDNNIIEGAKLLRYDAYALVNNSLAGWIGIHEVTDSRGPLIIATPTPADASYNGGYCMKQGPIAFRVGSPPSLAANYASPRTYNAIINGSGAASPGAEWFINNCTIAQSTTVVDSALNGVTSLAITPDAGSTVAHVSQLLPAWWLAKYPSGVVRVSFRYTGNGATMQKCGVVLRSRTTNITDERQYFTPPTTANWQDFSVDMWMDSRMTAPSIDIVVRTTGSSVNPLYISNLKVEAMTGESNY